MSQSGGDEGNTCHKENIQIVKQLLGDRVKEIWTFMCVARLMIGSQTVEDFRRNPYFFGGDGTEDTHLKVYCIGINEIFGLICFASLAVHCLSPKIIFWWTATLLLDVTELTFI